jgi:hypothetical protein
MEPVSKVSVGRSLKYLYSGILFDSPEEVYVYWWLQELLEHGIISHISYQPDPITLFNALECRVVKELKSGPAEADYTFLRSHVYTPDFSVGVTNLGRLLVFRDIYEVLPMWTMICSEADDLFTPTALIEVKPEYDKNNMTRLFTLNQKWLLDKEGVFVNLAIPNKLFAATFAPERYLFTDSSTRQRSFNDRNRPGVIGAEKFIAMRREYFNNVFDKRKILK